MLRAVNGAVKERGVVRPGNMLHSLARTRAFAQHGRMELGSLHEGDRPPPRRRILRKIGLSLLALLAAAIIAAMRPGLATDEERAILQAARRDFSAQPRACLSLRTSPAVLSGGHYWSVTNEPYTMAMNALRNRAIGRNRSLPSWDLWDLAPIPLLGGLWDRLGCRQIVRIGTPQIAGNLAFVNFEHSDHWSTVAYRRGSNGWTRMDSVSESRFARVI